MELSPWIVPPLPLEESGGCAASVVRQGSVCGFLRIPALTGKATHISSTSTYGGTTRSFKELKGREAENKMQQEVS